MDHLLWDCSFVNFGGIVTSRLLGLRRFVIMGVEIGLNITKYGSTII